MVAQAERVGAQCVGETNAAKILQHGLKRAEIAVVRVVLLFDPKGAPARGRRAAQRKERGGVGGGSGAFPARIVKDFERLGGEGGREEIGEQGGAVPARGEAEEVQAAGGPLGRGGNRLALEAPGEIGAAGIPDEVGGVGAQREGVGRALGLGPLQPIAAGNGLERIIDEPTIGQVWLPEPDFGDGAGGADQVLERVMGGVDVEIDGVPARVKSEGLGDPLGVGGPGRKSEQRKQRDGPAENCERFHFGMTWSGPVAMPLVVFIFRHFNASPTGSPAEPHEARTWRGDWPVICFTGRKSRPAQDRLFLAGPVLTPYAAIGYQHFGLKFTFRYGAMPKG